MGKNVCFWCKQQGHNAPNCPTRQGQGNNQGQNPRNTQRNTQGQRPPGNARVFAMNRQQAAQEPGNMAGMISISNIPILALFDAGATHSFISAKTYQKLGLFGEDLENALEVSLPSGKALVD